MLLLPLSFLITLSVKGQGSFGLSEISASLIIGVLSTLMLIWVKSLMFKNAYLGMIIGITALGIFEYSLFFRFSGNYTLSFAVLGSVIVLSFLGYHFIKSRKNPLTKEDLQEIEEEFEE